jgi:hypothetical protein
MTKTIGWIAGLCLLALCGCADKIPKDALQLQPDSMKLRQLQTRSFDTSDEMQLLSAGAGVLQDIGFAIDESETHLGLIVGSKDRDAVESGQVAGAIVMAVLFGAYTPIDKNQKIRASLVTRENGAKKINVRITVQRLIWDTTGKLSRIESVEDADIYQQFFEKLSKAVFLNANNI